MMTNLDKQLSSGDDNSAKKFHSSSTFRLILHIGAGKTGTSSIQETLSVNRGILQKQGVWYLGLMLEHSPVIRYPWQIVTGYFELIALREKEITRQLVDALDNTMSAIKLQGGHTAILSNESLFHHHVSPIFEALDVLCKKGWDIEVVAYVRRQDAWSKSAYIQWGLKDKSYEGKLLTYAQFFKVLPENFYKFSINLKSWMQFPYIKCNVRNADFVGDVVLDFFSINCIPLDGLQMVKRANTQPTNEELLLRAMFNNLFSEPVTPYKFDQVMESLGISCNLSANSFLNELLPTEEDIRKFVENNSKDIDEVNRILEEVGQPSLDTTPRDEGNREVDLGKVIAAIFIMLANSQIKNTQGLSGVIRKIDKIWLSLKRKFKGY